MWPAWLLGHSLVRNQDGTYAIFNAKVGDVINGRIIIGDLEYVNESPTNFMGTVHHGKFWRMKTSIEDYCGQDVTHIISPDFLHKGTGMDRNHSIFGPNTLKPILNNWVADY